MKKASIIAALLAVCLLASCDAVDAPDIGSQGDTSSVTSVTQSAPVESDDSSAEASSEESVVIEISLPEEVEPELGPGGEIQQLESTRAYEKEIGLCYSIDLAEYEQYIQPADVSEYLLLVNVDHPLDQNYKPSDLIKIVDMRAGRPDYYSYLREVPEKALEAFLDEAALYGFGDIKVSNGYRSYSIQSSLFNSYIDRETAAHPDWSKQQVYDYVATYSAPPGTSEHQSGLCVDMHNQIDTDSSFNGTPAALWLADNCYRFGFVLRFPEDKQEITGITFESWHFRFVGREVATEMHELGMCLEEYLEYKGLMP